jgi:hypothetical protein
VYLHFLTRTYGSGELATTTTTTSNRPMREERSTASITGYSDPLGEKAPASFQNSSENTTTILMDRKVVQNTTLEPSSSGENSNPHKLPTPLHDPSSTRDLAYKSAASIFYKVNVLL